MVDGDAEWAGWRLGARARAEGGVKDTVSEQQTEAAGEDRGRSGGVGERWAGAGRLGVRLG